MSPAPSNLPARIGRYAVEGRLGAGGMGEVFRARDPELGRPVAIKVLRGPLLEREDARLRFRREARALARVHHPGLIRILDWGEDGDGFHLVMDLVEGRPFDPRAGSLDQRLALLERVARAVDAAHRAGVVHRDLKPSNVLVLPDGRPILIDFGLAHLDDPDGLVTATTAVLGTPRYMAPEQVTGRPTGPWTDIHALGALLYEVLAGRPPYEGASSEECFELLTTELPSSLDGSIPADLRTVAVVALEKDPDDRYRSAQALADDLAAVQAGQPIAARRRLYVARAWSGSRTFRRRSIGVGILLVALVGVGVGSIALSGLERPVEEALPDPGEAGAGDLPGPAPVADDRPVIEARRALGRAEAGLYDRQVSTEEVLTLARSARHLLEEMLERDPGRALVHHLLARAWELEGWPRRAEAAWLEALELDPDLDAARFGLGLLLAERALIDSLASSGTRAGRTEGFVSGRQAASVLARAEHLDSPVERAIQAAYRAFGEGDLAGATGVVETAVAEMPGREGLEWLLLLHPFVARDSDVGRAVEAALALRPRFAPALHLRAIERSEAGDLAGARADYDEAIALRPGFAESLASRGSLLADLGEFEAAEADFERALEIAPLLASAHSNRGSLRYQEGRLDESLADLDRSIEIEPENVNSLNLRSRTHYGRGELDLAEADLRRALALDPTWKETLSNLALLLIDTGRLDEAISCLDRALAAAPGDVVALVLRGDAWSKKGDRDAALSDYGAALAAEPDRPEALFGRAHLLGAIGRRQESLADFDRLLEVDPDHLLGRYWRAFLLGQLGRIDDAVADYDRFLEIQPDHHQSIVNRAGLLARVGRIQESIDGFTRALELEPEDPVAWYFRGRARSLRQERAGAIADLERALELAPPDWPRRAETTRLLGQLRGR